MRIKKIAFQNYRCFENLRLDLDSYACFVGQNNAGKSTILKGIDCFFRSTPKSIPVTADDFNDPQKPLIINVTFTDLSEQAKDAFKHYYRSDELTFFIRSIYGSGIVTSSIHGMRLVIPELAPFFEASSAAEKKTFYNSVKDEFGFEPWSTKDRAEDCIKTFEMANPMRCEQRESRDDAFGAIGPLSDLRKYVEWIYVPAVKDVATEQVEARNSAFSKLVQRAVRGRLNIGAALDAIKTDAQSKISALLAENREGLQSLERLLDADFKAITSLDVGISLDWEQSAADGVSLKEPAIRSFLDDGGYRGDISSFGNGLQRNYLIALLQLNAKLANDEQPSLLLGCEEPELYQHPPQVRFLYRVFKKLSESNQVLITSHSPHFVSVRDFSSTFIVRKSGRCSRLCTHTIDKQLEAISIAKNEKQIPSPAGEAQLHSFLQSSVAEMFFCDRIIFVEGPEDQAIIETYLMMKGLWERFLKSGGHLISVGGKGNMIASIALAQGFELPFIAIFDADTDCDPKDAEKTKALNRLLFRISGHNVDDLDDLSWPERDVFTSCTIVWSENVQKSLQRDFAGWRDECLSISSQLGLPYGSAKKNPSLMEAALTSIVGQRGGFECLGKLAANLIAFTEMDNTPKLETAGLQR